ncbi:MAG: ATP-dependent helicase [Faecalicatena sp.]|uniref:ATP-dependent helicase n=1 Tax=Faecalicatena sp. TaxID=2005360 RepID=UPI002590EA49|nr:ATP-dependent helicase [Faecalicatena sp.]MCI6466847.1 ATP-dependent helicase [Faecalicatena sp.]MDY5619667.1 ATP-dependent helicase [Lachnospiraceae bacterium]
MSFSKAQTEAVTHGKGPCLVLAGPGSGKTLTIVNRMKYLIEELKVRPEEILVITFTKYAAAEMKNRFIQLMGNKSLPVTVGTFHGIYYGILKWAYRFGPQNILSEEEKYQLIRHVVNHQEIEIFDEEDFLQEIATEIGKIKNNRLDIEEYRSVKCDPAAFCNIYREYENERKRVRKIDFDDMLVLCCELFQSREDILRMWQEKFQYILIDEFQDINQVQYDVIKMLAAPQNNLFAVGDDDQSIYGFRGADAKLMFQFQKDFPDAKQILLDINYRSTSNIVENALKVIANNELRFEKAIHANKERGAGLHVQEVRDPVEEAEYVLDEIQSRIEAGGKPEDIAVLFRIHTDARPLVEGMMERKIPFQMREHMPNVYNHFIAKDIRTYFKMALGSRERQEFLQIMNRPKRYIGRDSLSGKTVAFEDLRRFYCDKDWMLDRVDQFEWDLKMLVKMAPYAAIQYLRKRIGYDDFLREYAKERKVKINDLFEVLAELEEASRPFATLEEWFTHVEEYTNALKLREKKREEIRDGVRLMTMHAAKGLEFDTVYIIEANEGQVPYKKALKEQGVEEERRLFYVAMTRAKEVLKIIYVKNKNGKETSPSRFVDELFLV